MPNPQGGSVLIVLFFSKVKRMNLRVEVWRRLWGIEKHWGAFLFKEKAKVLKVTIIYLFGWCLNCLDTMHLRSVILIKLFLYWVCSSPNTCLYSPYDMVLLKYCLGFFPFQFSNIWVLDLISRTMSSILCVLFKF